MDSPTCILAETDPRTLELLPRILSDRIPRLVIDICTSAEDLSRKLGSSAYEMIVSSPTLLPHYLAFKKRYDRLLARCLVIAGREDRAWASTALQGDAFDLIVKPMVPDQAVQAVTLALWHYEFLQLLASRERAVSRFREHIAAFRHHHDAEGQLVKKLALLDRTLQDLNASEQHLRPMENESVLFDIATTIEALTRERAFARLRILCQEDGVPVALTGERLASNE